MRKDEFTAMAERVVKELHLDRKISITEFWALADELYKGVSNED